MIKVVEAISDTNIGGAGVLLINRVRHSDRTRFNTIIVLPRNSKLVERFQSIKVDVVEIDGCADKSFDIRSLIRYIVTIKRLHPDIVNSHGCMNSRIAAMICSVPVRIYTRHCVFPIKKRETLPIRRMFFSFVTELLTHKVIAVSHSAARDLQKMGLKQSTIEVIINGAEKLKRLSYAERQLLKQTLGISPEEIVVTMCARLEPYKDHKCFLRAAEVLLGEDRDFRFIVMGDGSLKKELQKEALRLNIQDKVIFTGFVDDVTPYMNITDINVNCSVGTETSSLALSEGMSLGIPAVVSNYGGNPYMVKNGVNGYVYNSGDFIELAGAIKKLAIMKRNGKYDIFSARSRHRFESELNAENMAQRTEKLYDDMINLKNKKYAAK